MYTQHLDLLTIEVHVPNRRRSKVLITERQHRLVSYHAAHKGKGKTQRQMAAETGYSLAGYNEALHQMRKLGLLALSTTRGWAGSTTAWLIKGVRVLGHKVREAMFGTVDRGTSEVRSTVETLPNIEVERATGPPKVGPQGVGEVLEDLRRKGIL